MKIGVFHPGTQHSWQTAEAFQNAALLRWYATSIFYEEGRFPYNANVFLPPKIGDRVLRELKRRYTPNLDPRLIRRLGLAEWLEMSARRLGLGAVERFINDRGNTRFESAVTTLIEKEPVDVLWGYNTSSETAFQWAKKRGIFCVLDQTIGHARTQNEVMAAEFSAHAEFFQHHYRPFNQRWIAKQDAELELADLIVVGNDTCAQTLLSNGCSPEKIRTVPYGFDERLYSVSPNAKPDRSRPLRCLYIGALTPRKGIAYLLQAFRLIPKQLAFLTLVGPLDIPAETFETYRPYVNWVGNVPRKDVITYYENADCFIFPSLFEGSAIVLAEAVGAGLAIIQSASAGRGALHDLNGLIVKDRSADAIVEAVTLLARDRNRLIQMKEASVQLRDDYTWRRYRQRIQELVKSFSSVARSAHVYGI